MPSNLVVFSGNTVFHPSSFANRPWTLPQGCALPSLVHRESLISSPGGQLLPSSLVACSGNTVFHLIQRVFVCAGTHRGLRQSFKFVSLVLREFLRNSPGGLCPPASVPRECLMDASGRASMCPFRPSRPGRFRSRQGFSPCVWNYQESFLNE